MYGDYQDVYNADQDPTGGGYGGPTGVPDPNNPGMDTAGYPLSARTAPPSATPGQGFTSGPGFTNTSPVKPSQPTNIPDPNNPEYDTAGFLLGSSRDAQGNLHIPNPVTGRVATTPAGTLNTTYDPLKPPPPPPGSNLQGGALANFGEGAPAFPNEPAYTASRFTAPTIGDAINNPGYQFRVQQGRDSLQNWAAARGTLNDTGTAKALEDYGQNAAEQGYGEVYARTFNDWQANEDAQRQAYGMNRISQHIDPWTAAYNAWAQRGNWYLQNQGTVANTALGFASL